MKSDGHITIERTAKKYKLAKLLSALGIIVGIFWIMGAHANSDVTGVAPNLAKPIALIVISGIVYIVTKFLIWWNHG